MEVEQRKQILEALDSPELLTDWEYDFVDSLAALDEDRKLSERQSEILAEIAEKL